MGEGVRVDPTFVGSSTLTAEHIDTPMPREGSDGEVNGAVTSEPTVNSATADEDTASATAEPGSVREQIHQWPEFYSASVQRAINRARVVSLQQRAFATRRQKVADTCVRYINLSAALHKAGISVYVDPPLSEDHH
jgi:hypothetical protein